MQKTKLWPEIKNFLIIDASYKYLVLCTRQKFRQNRRKTIISRDICKKRKYGLKTKNHFVIDSSLRIPTPLVTRKFRQNCRKTIISRDICKNEIMLRNRKPFGN